MIKGYSILLAPCFLLALAGTVEAQEQVRGHECGVEREVSPAGLTERTHNRLSDIYEKIGDEAYTEAFDDLEHLLERTRRQEYEQATIYQAMAFVRAQQERYEEAIEYFNRSIELDRMPNSQHFEMILQVAQLYYALERYRDSLDQLEFWFCVVPDDQTNVADVWVMKASIHSQIEEFREAIEAIDTAIAISDEPREQWYQLKLGMHFELDEYRQASDVLRILIRMSPEKKNYWVQLSSILTELEEERDARAVLALAHRKGLLDRQTEYLQLASLQQAHDAPRKAAEIMEDGLDKGVIEGTRQNWEMTAGAWYEARELEKALNAYEQAGALADDGKLDLQRAFILVDMERWDEASDALERALALGGLSETEIGNAWLLRGISAFNRGLYDEALEHFNEASNYGRVERAAGEWINQVREERSRQASR